ncbi:MAG: 2-C-methyl-D-erythritol 4-phosphate cytidylyltransferase [Candidatus Binataceae bacterium]
MKASAIIVAAGSGRRLGLDVPKAFVRLAGHPMLYYTMRTIAAVDAIEDVVVAVPRGMEEQARSEVRAAGLETPVKLVAGGGERQDSVRIALVLTSAESELVVVHDASRPFASAELYRACLAAAARCGGAIAAIAVADTLKRAEDRTIRATIPRAGLFQAQTPQAFRRDLLVAAHQRAERERAAVTDDAELVERFGGKVEIVEGSPLNLKITTPADLKLAEALVASFA